MTPKAPTIDWEALSPLLALTGGACLVLMVGLLRSGFVRRHVVPALAVLALAITAGLGVWQWGVNTEIVERSLAIDDLTLTLMMVFCGGGIAAVLLSWRSRAVVEAGEGEYYALLLSSILGMVVLVAAQNLIALFLGFELLSIPLYVLCATHMRREASLESGLKYLIVGSVGSATLLYGLALLYGATGTTDYAGIAEAATSDVLLYTGIALVVAGLAFKASVAPFHQWTPDVYEGAPTAITGFMAVATKAAAFGVMLRLFDVALIDSAQTWGPLLAVLALITIVVGNVGAIGQSSLKRMLAYSSIAQAGYMLAGVLVSTRLGVQATVFYLIAYTVMNLGAFAVIVARERETGLGDDISSLYGLGADRPLLAWPMTIAMLALAGFPATAGFFGKVYLIDATVRNDYGWVGVAIVIGSAISLAYYLRVVAAVWMRSPSEAVALRPGRVPGGRPAIAGGSQEADAELVAAPPRHRQPELVFVAVVCALATIFLGVYPEPVFEVARDAGAGSDVTRLGGEFSAAPPTGGVSSSAEYTALLGLVGAALAGTGAVVGLETIGDAVANGVRTGICIVAGDVCRASDAEAAGLAPCTVAESTRGEGLTFTVASIRFGADDAWTASRRSDGTVIVTHTDERRLGGKVGIGVEASPLGLNAEMSGKLDYTLMSGRAWEFPDSALGAALPRRPGARGPCSGDVALRRRRLRGRRRGGGGPRAADAGRVRGDGPLRRGRAGRPRPDDVLPAHARRRVRRRHLAAGRGREDRGPLDRRLDRGAHNRCRRAARDRLPHGAAGHAGGPGGGDRRAARPARPGESRRGGGAARARPRPAAAGRPRGAQRDRGARGLRRGRRLGGRRAGRQPRRVGRRRRLGDRARPAARRRPGVDGRVACTGSRRLRCRLIRRGSAPTRSLRRPR